MLGAGPGCKTRNILVKEPILLCSTKLSSYMNYVLIVVYIILF